jgi:hypothetical protein
MERTYPRAMIGRSSIEGLLNFDNWKHKARGRSPRSMEERRPIYPIDAVRHG